MRASLTTIIAALALGLFAAVPARAQSSRLYLAGYMGLNILHDQHFDESTKGNDGGIGYNNGPSFAGALGLRLNQNLRLETELSYRDSSIAHMNFSTGAGGRAGGDVKTWLLMLNLYYDFNFNWHNVQPYVTAGVGLAHERGSISTSDTALAPSSGGVDTVFAYQAGTGLKYRVSPDMAFTGGYRFIGSSDANIGSYKTRLNAHEFRVGVEYDLPVDWMK